MDSDAFHKFIKATNRISSLEEAEKELRKLEDSLGKSEMIVGPFTPPSNPKIMTKAVAPRPKTKNGHSVTEMQQQIEELEKQKASYGLTFKSAVGVVCSLMLTFWLFWPLGVLNVILSLCWDIEDWRLTKFLDGFFFGLFLPLMTIHRLLPKKKKEQKFSFDSYSAHCYQLAEKEGIAGYDKVIKSIEEFERNLERQT